MGAASRKKWDSRRKRLHARTVSAEALRIRWREAAPDLLAAVLAMGPPLSQPAQGRAYIDLLPAVKPERRTGMPRKHCPARMGKVQLRDTHYRERMVIDEIDERGNPSKWHYVSEPLIERRVGKFHRDRNRVL